MQIGEFFRLQRDRFIDFGKLRREFEGRLIFLAELLTFSCPRLKGLKSVLNELRVSPFSSQSILKWLAKRGEIGQRLLRR